MSIKLNLIFSGLITLITVATQLVVLSILGKEGPELLAYYNLIEIFFAIVPAIILFGGDQYFQYKINQIETDKDKLSFYFGYILLSIILLLISSVIGGIYLVFFNDHNVFHVLSFLCVSIASFLIYISSYLYRSNLKVIQSSFIERSFYLFNSLVLFIICFLYRDAVTPEYVLTSALLVSLILSVFFIIKITKITRENRDLRFLSTKNLWPIFNDVKGRYFWFTAILIFIYERVDQLFILNVFDYKLLGFYFACYKLSFLPRLFTNIVYSVIYPYLAKMLQHSKDDALKLHSVSFYLTVSIAIFFGLPMIFAPEFILSFVFDTSFATYAELLKVIVISMIISCVNQINYSMLNANGRGQVIFLNAIISVFVQLLVIYSFYVSFGLLAIAYARLAVGLTGILIYIYASGIRNLEWHKLITVLSVYGMLLV